MPFSVRRWDDPASWNSFVSATPGAHFQQSWEWGELAADLGGQCARLGLVQDEKLVGAAQVFINPVSRFKKTRLYVPRGPALARPALEMIGPLLDAARDLGRDVNAIGIQIEPNVPDCNPSWKQALAALGLRPVHPPTQPRSSWMLDIAPEADALLAAMKPKTRYNIRLAARKGVDVVEGNARDVGAFYALYRETAARDDFFIHPIDFYRRMFDLFWQTGRFALLLARYQGELIAAITLLHFGDTCWYLQGASSNRHRNLMATYLLQWEGIQWAQRAGCRQYDFRAVPDLLREDQDMYGVYRFKEGFGGYHHTTLPTYAAPYQYGWHGMWLAYVAGRFALTNLRRRRRGQPVRQFA